MFFILRSALICWFLFSILNPSFCQSNYDYDDGPYIFEKADSFDLFWVSDGKLKEMSLLQDEAFVFSEEGLPSVDFNFFRTPEKSNYQFDSISRFVAISDVHGQYDLMVKLLQVHQVIDSSLNWIYGDGHLVILGDIFDRGDKVMDCLWFIYQLEQKAKASNGKVHMLLGNHELMVLHGDIRYVHPKYRYTMGVTQKVYPDLFLDNSILGKWLRSKPIYIRINDVGFVHGGFSKSIIEKENDLNTINELFLNDIIPSKSIEEDSTSLLSELYFDNGPLWYRGYANPEGFDSTQLKFILDRLDLGHIVVGHTSMPRIVSRNHNRIFLIDSSIKFGKSGEILVYENDHFYSAKLDGSLNELTAIRQKANRENTTFKYVYDQAARDLTVRIDTDLDKLLSADDEVYQAASLIAIHNREENRKWNIRIRQRGNMRKKLCKYPPFKIDFVKSDLEASGFVRNDKLNLISVCEDNKQGEQALYREEMIYHLYGYIDTLALRTRLVNIELMDFGKMKKGLVGFFVEDDDNFESRTDAKIIEYGVIYSAGLDRDMYLKMGMFQYMIRNTDWSIGNRHNVKIVHDQKSLRVRAIPYDFDYSGLVNQSYAVPFESFPINRVTSPYFIPKRVSYNELLELKLFFGELKFKWKNHVKNSKYLDKKSKKRFYKYIDDFYKVLENEDKWKKAFRYIPN